VANGVLFAEDTIQLPGFDRLNAATVETGAGTLAAATAG
jgi:hypothetical protein